MNRRLTKGTAFLAILTAAITVGLCVQIMIALDASRPHRERMAAWERSMEDPPDTVVMVRNSKGTRVLDTATLKERVLMPDWVLRESMDAHEGVTIVTNQRLSQSQVDEINARARKANIQ